MNLDSSRTTFALSSIAHRLVSLANEAMPSAPVIPSSMLETMPVHSSLDSGAAMAHGELLFASTPAIGPRLTRLCYGKQPVLDSDIAMMREVPAHFDVNGIKVDGPYALHTEYASKSRALDSALMEGLTDVSPVS